MAKTKLITFFSILKNEKAYDNEYLLIPQQIKEKVNTLLKEIDSVSIVYPYPMDTTINHKSEIINHKSEIINRDFNKIEDITNSVLQEISEKYG